MKNEARWGLIFCQMPKENIDTSARTAYNSVV